MVPKLSGFPQKTQVKGEFTLVVQLARSGIEKNTDFNPFMEIKLVDPSGEVLAKNEVPLKFEEGKNNLRAIIGFDSFLLTQPGRYEYIISVKTSEDDKFKEVASTPIEVKIYE